MVEDLLAWYSRILNSYLLNPDKPEPNRFEDKKIDHESTKIRRHESLNVVLFRAFNLS